MIYRFLCRIYEIQCNIYLFCIDQFKRWFHLVRHHLHVTLLVASDDHRDELGSEKPLLSLRRKLFWL